MKYLERALYYMMVCVLTIACSSTTIELDTDDHTHEADVQFYFNFGAVSEKPDTMIVLAVRNLNYLCYTYHLSTKGGMTSPANGSLAFPMELRQHIEGTKDDYVRLHAGSYELLTFSGDDEHYTNNLSPTMNTDAQSLDQLYVTHVTYPDTKSHPSMYRDKDWVSYNMYADYILGGDEQPTFISKQMLNVEREDRTKRVDFSMSDVSQRVTIDFTITKDKDVVIDSVKAEISGLAHRIYLMTEIVDVSRTFKTLFHPTVTPANNKDATVVNVSGKIFTHGLMRSADPTYTTGSGILWMKVYTHTWKKTEDKNTKVSKSVIACVNLYNLLGSHPSLYLNTNDEIRQTTKDLHLTIPSVLLNIENKTVTSSDQTALDAWKTLVEDPEKEGSQNGSVGVDL